MYIQSQSLIPHRVLWENETCFYTSHFHLKAYLCNIYVNVPIYYEWIIAIVHYLNHERTNSLVTTLQSSDIWFGKLHTIAMLGDVYVCSQGWGFLLKFLNHLHFSICHHSSILNDIHRKAIVSIYRWVRELPAVTKKQCKDWFQTDFSTVYRLPEFAFYLLNILSLHPWIQCVDSCCISQGHKFKHC